MKRFFYTTLILCQLFLSACATDTRVETSASVEVSNSAQQKTPLTDASIESEPVSTSAPTATANMPPGKELVVTSKEDSGPGSLRMALKDMYSNKTIHFDPQVFPPDAPATIFLKSGLPILIASHVTIDASDAGVILDGSEAAGEWTVGLEIQSSNNIVRGLEIRNFSGAGIVLQAGANDNIIGGDRTIGSGPFGQGNLIHDTSDGLGLRGSNNTISGNLIGTDSSGKEKWGNRNPGIFVEETASNNTIGPNNVIAYNGLNGCGGGVEFRSQQALGNRVTQNDIHDNKSSAIYNNLTGGETRTLVLASPLLLDYDLESGSVSGITCPGCEVEFFSTTPAGNDIFEGSVTANADGNFNFSKTKGFQSQEIKATAYIEGHNTSEFSLSTSGKQRSLAIQMDNSNQRSLLPTVPYKDIAQNHIGTMHYVNCENFEIGEAEGYFSNATEMGYRWMRVSVEWYDWAEIEQTGEYTDFSVTPCQDKAIDLLYENGVSLLYTIVYWDPDLKLAPGQSRFTTEEEIQRYLDYVRFIAGHFKGKIKWYGILNEPNLPNDGQGTVKVEDYIKLVRRVIPVIHEVDPQAKVIIGEVCPLNQNGALEYLREIVASDVVSQADGIAWHNSSELSPEHNLDYYRNNPLWMDEIATTAGENGFDGQFFSTEYQWRTQDSPQPRGDSPWFYTNAVSGKYTARGLLEALGKGYWVIVGHENYESIPETVRVISSLTGLLGGANPVELPLKVSETGDKVSSVAFTLPDGNQLLALWRDIKAADFDPGKAVTLTLAGVNPQKAIAIDPLYGYRQELLVSQSEDGLVVENFLLKDYPIILQLQP